ncbi:MAG: hypothetical protein H8E44_34660 [Planctomycetes bacterium]|nr:hypothetical protein [Planctomycetota bacterium]MBL7040361.1 hypothetical protein [Pirellulaceae bacterium]
MPVLDFVLESLAGILYPAKSPRWARAQKIAAVLGAIALLLFVVAFIVGRFEAASFMAKPLGFLGGIALLGYLAIGVVCAIAHEKTGPS